MSTNESGTTMAERRRYYALTDDVETLIRAAETWARTLQMTDRPAEAELRAVSNLTPLDEDDAVTEDMVERAARVFYEHPTPGVDASLRKSWDRLATICPEVADNHRAHVRDVLDAALGTGEEA